jgi:hypothetical protein
MSGEVGRPKAARTSGARVRDLIKKKVTPQRSNDGGEYNLLRSEKFFFKDPALRADPSRHVRGRGRITVR